MSVGSKKIWNTLFLDERPSIGLSFFRIFVALTVGCHVIPSFFHLDDNFLSTAFKEVNLNFFTPNVVELVQKSPDGLVYFFVGLFCTTWFFFLVGFFSQINCILMTLCCYYFYALNCFHIGTLSWDILLVTLFVMCVSPYHGDYFSIDCLRQNNVFAFRRKRPFFVQQLLQMQIASTYFYTALYKITAAGNWLRDNPIYYLLNYPSEGVTKNFFLREFFSSKPELCYWVGILIIICELFMPLLLFIPRTRVFAIVLGFFFHIILVATLHVPTIFFFLFPPQLLLFINPDDIIAWIEKKRILNHEKGQMQIIYDGRCQFCLASIEKLLVMDLFGCLKGVNYHKVDDLKTIHSDLTKDLCHSQIHLVETNGRISGGFFVFRRVCFKIPMLYPLIVLFYFPGTKFFGPLVYSWIAKNRYLFHFGKVCANNACFR